MRLVTAIAFLLLTTLAGTANAEHHHADWWKFWEGDWEYANSLGDGKVRKGAVSYAMAPVGAALLAEWRNADDGESSIEVVGWQSNNNAMVVNGYGTEGNSWQIAFDKIESDKLGGSHVGVLPDGTTYEGTIVVKQVNPDLWTWESDGKSADGKPHRMSGKVTRKK